MREFWVSSGHHLTQRTDGGGLAVTDELLLAYLARPELVPPEDACPAERALHASLLVDPRRDVDALEIEALADADARENWSFMIAFRDRLVKSRTVEDAYLAIVRDGIQVPPLFLNHLVHLILRNALDGCDDPFVLRAAELFFRAQRASLHEGAMLLADLELIEEHQNGHVASPLVQMLGRDPVAELDILDEENAWTYWSRSDAFTMALAIGSQSRSREGLARAIETFVLHLLNVGVRVTPLERIEDRDWRWFVGLDAEGTRIGNRLWRNEEIEPEAGERVLALFRLEFEPETAVEPRVEGRSVYLIMAMDEAGTLRMKPQNLIVGLPLRARSRAV
jgi:Family of unknown function (DUF6352)